MKKMLSILLAAVMLVSAVPTAFAADTQDYSQGTQVVFEAANNESYTITVPASLQPGQSGTVTLAGSWPSNKTISVTAESTVTLTNSILATDQKVLDITFLGISKAGNDTTAQTFTETVSVEGIENALFGTWSGHFNYNVDSRMLLGAPMVTNVYYTDKEGGSNMRVGLTDENMVIFDDGTSYTMSELNDDELKWEDNALKMFYEEWQTGEDGYYISDWLTVLTVSEDGQKVTIPDGPILTLDENAPINIKYAYIHGEGDGIPSEVNMIIPFDPNMTWGEWIDTKYSNDYLFAYFTIDENDNIAWVDRNGEMITYADGTPVKATDKIIEKYNRYNFVLEYLE